MENIVYKSGRAQVWMLSWKLERYCLGLLLSIELRFSTHAEVQQMP